MREKTYNATRKRIISYNRGDIIKRFSYLDVTFTNVLYIPILMNNLYSVRCLCYCRWDINMKHSGKTNFTIAIKIVGYANEIQREYVM